MNQKNSTHHNPTNDDFSPQPSFDGKDLSHIDMEGRLLYKGNFSESILDYANLKRCDLSGAKLEHVHMHNALAHCANFENINAINCNIHNTNLVSANLRQADFSNSKIINCNMQNAICLGTIFQKTNLLDSDLSGAILINADLREANLSQCNLTGAILTGALLEKAVFDEAILQDTVISEEQLRVASSYQGVVFHERKQPKLQIEGAELIPVQLFLDDFLLAWYEAEAKTRRQSFNELATQALMDYLNNTSISADEAE